MTASPNAGGRNRRSGTTGVTDEGVFVKMAKLVVNYCERALNCDRINRFEEERQHLNRSSGKIRRN